MSVVPPFPPDAFVHHFCPRLVLDAAFDEVVRPHQELARVRGLHRSLTRTRRGQPHVAFATALYARKMLGVSGVGRIQVTQHPRGSAFLLPRAAVDLIDVGARFLQAAGCPTVVAYHNMAYLELAVAVRMPREGQLPAMPQLTARPRPGSPVRLLHRQRRRGFTSSEARVPLVARLYHRTNDPNPDTAKLEICTGRIHEDGHLSDEYFRPDSKSSFLQLLQPMGSELRRLLDVLDPTTKPMPLSYRGIPLIWGNLKAWDQDEAYVDCANGRAENSRRRLGSQDGVLLFDGEPDQQVLPRLLKFAPFLLARFLDWNPLIVGPEDELGDGDGTYQTQGVVRYR